MSKHRPAKVERFLSQAPPPSPDLFGIVQPPRITSSKPKPEAEWPAGKNRRAGDRAPRLRSDTSSGETGQCVLFGRYKRTGASLSRPDGRTLQVRLSTRPGRPPRYIWTEAPGIDRYCGSLFNDARTGEDDLDQWEFQDLHDLTRYRITLDEDGRYIVAPVRRWGRKGR